MSACNGGKQKTDNQTEKQTESVKATEEVTKATEAVTEASTESETEVTTEESSDIQISDNDSGKEVAKSVDADTASKKEESTKQNEVSEQKPASDNKTSDSNQNDGGNASQSNNTQQGSEGNQQPAPAAYSPQNVVALATAKCQSGGMITTQQNLQNHLNDGSITQEEYNEYYPYDGMEESYYSVFVETDLNKASTIDGQRLSSEDAIAGYIASMLLLETDPVFYISYDGVYTTGGTDYYEFRCHR